MKAIEFIEILYHIIQPYVAQYVLEFVFRLFCSVLMIVLPYKYVIILTITITTK